MIIVQKHRQIDIPACSVDQMVTADGGGITVTGDHNYVQIGFGHFEAGGKCNCPAMGGMERIEVNIAGRPAGTSDPGYHCDIVFLDPEIIDGTEDGLERNAVPAAFAPDMWKFILAQILHVINMIRHIL
jgi:hypothetical protein